MNRIGLISFVLTIAVMSVISAVVLSKLPPGSKIPMQWDLSGRPTWYAPKYVGVWFSPMLAVLIIGVTNYAASTVQTVKPGIFVIMSLSFIVFHAIHMWFAAKA